MTDSPRRRYCLEQVAECDRRIAKYRGQPDYAGAIRYYEEARTRYESEAEKAKP